MNRAAAFISAVLAVIITSSSAVYARAIVGDGTAASCTEVALDAALAQGGDIAFDCGGATTIAVTGPRTIARDTRIDGGGATALSGEGQVPLLVVATGVEVTLRGMRLVDGASAGDPGGAIRNFGTLIVEETELLGNRSLGFGGAIANEGHCILRDSLLAGNLAVWGGAVANFGTLRVERSVVFDNEATYRAERGSGGGVANYGSLLAVNSTFSNNRPQPVGASHGVKAGSLDNEGVAILANCTFSTRGDSDSTCSAIFNNGELTASNTLLTTTLGEDCCVGPAAVFAGGVANLSDGAFPHCDAAFRRVSPAALRARGLDAVDTTLGVTLAPGSVALGAGDTATCAAADLTAGVDQRGRPRFAAADGGCDVGAIEAEREDPPPTPSVAWTSFDVTGPPDEFIARGQRFHYRDDHGGRQIVAYGSAGAVRVRVDTGREQWTIAMQAPFGMPLGPGTYEGAMRYPFQDASVPGLSVSGIGRGCSRLNGRFTVQAVTLAIDGAVETFAADFEQYCEGAATALVGSIRIDSPYPSAVPAPRCPGDCGLDGQVSVADLISAVRVAIGDEPVSACGAADLDGDGTVSVVELVAAVGAAVGGCAL